MKLVKYTVFASAWLAALTVGTFAQNADAALEGGDQAAILRLLRQQVKAAPSVEAPTVAEPVAVAPVVVKPVSAIRTLAEDKKADDFSSDELQHIRARLAAELEAAKAQAKAEADAKAVVEKPVTPKVKKSGGLFGKMFKGKKAKASASKVSAPARPAFDRPDVAASNMKSNRDALDSLLTSSRQDVVKQAMDLSAGGGQQGSVNIVGEDKDWRETGPNAWKYNGEWTGGTMSGQGRLEFADGWSYVGSWINGAMSGQGTLLHPDGTKYEGQWLNGKMHGLGKLTYPDGWQFIGQWTDGQITGQGTLVHPGE